MIEFYQNTIPKAVNEELRLLELQHAELSFAFQNMDFFQLHEGLSESTPCCIIKRSADKEIQGFLIAILLQSYPFGKWGRRCMVWNGPMVLVKTEKKKLTHKILESLKLNLGTEALFIEIRNFQNSDQIKPAFVNNGFSFKDHLGMRVKLTSIESAWSGLSETKKRQIRRSKEAGVSIKDACTKDELLEFYGILQHLYKRKLKKPLPSFSFFEALMQSDVGQVLLIMHNKAVIGGVVLLYETNKGVYEWYIAGSDAQYKNLYPSVMATWAGMEYGCNKGHRFFDFMGGGKPHKNYGVREFKLRFGASVENNGRWFYSKYNSLLKFANIFLPSKL